MYGTSRAYIFGARRRIACTLYDKCIAYYMICMYYIFIYNRLMLILIGARRRTLCTLHDKMYYIFI